MARHPDKPGADWPGLWPRDMLLQYQLPASAATLDAPGLQKEPRLQTSSAPHTRPLSPVQLQGPSAMTPPWPGSHSNSITSDHGRNHSMAPQPTFLGGGSGCQHEGPLCGRGGPPGNNMIPVSAWEE